MDNNRSGGKSRRNHKSRPKKKGSGNANGQNRRRPRGPRPKHNYKPIDAELMVHEAVPMKKVKYIADKKYDDWDIHPKLKIAIRQAGWKFPTEIQEKSFENTEPD